jgi:Cobalamin-independent synthase, N-terminal domain
MRLRARRAGPRSPPPRAHRAGIDLVGVDSTLYDQVLDMSAVFGLVPERFNKLQGLERYFAMARGAGGAQALDMSKYFNTNYHYLVRSCSPPRTMLALHQQCNGFSQTCWLSGEGLLDRPGSNPVRGHQVVQAPEGMARDVQVPEISTATQPKLAADALLAKVQRAQAALGKGHAVPMVIGPLTMARLAALDGIDVAGVVTKLTPLYVELLKKLDGLGVRTALSAAAAVV